MSSSGLGSNPFAALFGSVEQAQQFSQTFREEKGNLNPYVMLNTAVISHFDICHDLRHISTY